MVGIHGLNSNPGSEQGVQREWERLDRVVGVIETVSGGVIKAVERNGDIERHREAAGSGRSSIWKMKFHI